MKNQGDKKSVFFRVSVLLVSLLFLSSPQFTFASEMGGVMKETARDFLLQVVKPTAELPGKAFHAAFASNGDVSQDASAFPVMDNLWNSIKNFFTSNTVSTDGSAAPVVDSKPATSTYVVPASTSSSNPVQQTQPKQPVVTKTVAVVSNSDTPFLQNQINALNAKIASLSFSSSPATIVNNTYVTNQSSGGGYSVPPPDLLTTTGNGSQLTGIPGPDLSNLSNVSSFNGDNGTLFLDSVNHRVGISTTTPSSALSVVGDINFTGNLLKNGVIFSAGGSATTTGNNLFLQASTTNGSDIPFVVKQQVGSNADLTDWLGSGGNILDSISSNGLLFAAGANINSLQTPLIFDQSNGQAIDITNRALYDLNNNIRVDWTNGLLYRNDGITTSLNWQTRQLQGVWSTNNTLTLGGNLIASGHNITTDTSVGTIIGTGVNQKIGFFNATPVVQQAATIDLGTVLSNLGLRAAGTAYPITTSGALTLSGKTQGSILFAGAGGLVSQDNSNLFYDATNGRLGIGTTTPGSALTVVGNGYFGGNLTSTGTFSFTGLGTSTLAGPLILSTSTDSSPFSYGNIAAWGDSITQGECNTSTDGTKVDTAACGINSYPSQLSALSGHGVYNGGVGGETSAQIATRMLADKDRHAYPTIIWAGRNDISDGISQSITLSNIAAMVNSLKAVGNNNYVVVGVYNTRNEPSGSGNYNSIIALNAALAAAYPGHFWDVRSYLVSQYNSGNSQDVIDHGNDVPPTSLMQYDFGYYTHPNTTGNKIIAQGMIQNVFPIIENYPNAGKVVTDYRLNKIFEAPPIIGSAHPNDAFFKSLFIGANASSTASGVQSSNNFSLFTINGFNRVSSTTDAATPFLGSTDIAPLRANLSQANDWTLGSGWSGSYGSGFTHDGTGSNTATLSEALTQGQQGVLVTMTISGGTNGWFNMSIGGQQMEYNVNSNNLDAGPGGMSIYFAQNRSGTITISTSAFPGDNSGLIITPSSDFNGTISNITVQPSFEGGWGGSSLNNAGFSPTIAINDSAGLPTSELRFSSSSLASAYIGLGAGANQIGGAYNYGFGNSALLFNKTGSRNVAMGSQALYNVVSGSYNVAIGDNAGFGGCGAGAPGGFGNCAVASGNVAIGDSAWMSGVGNSNVAIGNNTLRSLNGGANQSSGNIAIGALAGYSLRTAGSEIAIGGSALQGASQANQFDVVVGVGSLDQGVDSYAANTIFGSQSGRHIANGFNTIIGFGAGNNIINGIKNTEIGWQVDLPTDASNMLDIGNLIYGTGIDGTGANISTGNIGIGTTTPGAQFTTTGTVQFNHFGMGTVQTDANGNLTVSSDERLKDIQGSFSDGLDQIMALNPILYKWKASTGLDTMTTYAGFSAQNVQSVIPEAVGQDKNGFLTLQDRPIEAALVNAVKDVANIAGTFQTNLIAWLGDASNGIENIFAKKVTTQELCVGSTCVTESQLKILLQNSGQSGTVDLPTDNGTSTGSDISGGNAGDSDNSTSTQGIDASSTNPISTSTPDISVSTSTPPDTSSTTSDSVVLPVVSSDSSTPAAAPDNSSDGSSTSDTSPTASQ